ncbi:hypothetical protein HNP55_001988 [Paucibacter oligotrophus]|uniref:Uncharacterized protein n=1 Tax=Roseateles oligotrophus TaxID=1769250 RepID=A0A840LBJ0_9BURK|nr:hypothetical protein [Roseateles oligotrophus]MBB4843469.1 hypothetical protein [Roseateles oligotrophus]
MEWASSPQFQCFSDLGSDQAFKASTAPSKTPVPPPLLLDFRAAGQSSGHRPWFHGFQFGANSSLKPKLPCAFPKAWCSRQFHKDSSAGADIPTDPAIQQ